MPLTTAPEVQFGTDPTWHPTVWDDTLPAASVARGARRLHPSDVQFLRWTVSVDNEPARVFKLLCAGPLATAPPGAVALPAGRTATHARITDLPEVLIRRTGDVEVIA